jgi:hypothetical protein
MRKFSLLFVLLLMAMPSVANAETGDVNGDGEIGIKDVTQLIDMLLKGQASAADNPASDVNADGHVTIADMMELIDIILYHGTEPEYVDLGLPSGTLWATKNIGASSPEEYGDYFCWGETAPKDTYTIYNYKWGSTYPRVKKYCTNSQWGPVDSLTVLEPEDDAAYVNWGPSWRMPTDEEIKELNRYCHPWVWTEINGVYGKLGTGPSGRTIFLPAGGYRFDSEYDEGDGLYYEGEQGYYWSSTLGHTGGPDAYYLLIYNSTQLWSDNITRSTAFNVRAVRD